jgi:hypothetical protein
MFGSCLSLQKLANGQQVNSSSSCTASQFLQQQFCPVKQLLRRYGMQALSLAE